MTHALRDGRPRTAPAWRTAAVLAVELAACAAWIFLGLRELIFYGVADLPPASDAPVAAFQAAGFVPLVGTAAVLLRHLAPRRSVVRQVLLALAAASLLAWAAVLVVLSGY
jgi:hypothetical protein